MAESCRVMKDDAHRMPPARAQPAHRMPHVDAVDAPRSPHWAMVHGEYDRITLCQRDDFGPRLHPRPLFRQQELATGEIATGLREKKGHLQREDMLSIDVLVETVEVTS